MTQQRIGLVVLAVVASGQPARADQAIDAQIFKPALDGFGIFATERAIGPAQWDFGVRAGLGYAQAPLRLAVENIGTPGDRDRILDSQLTVDLGVSFGITSWLTFAFDVPLQVQPLGAGYGTDGRYRPVDPGDESMFQPGTGFYSVRPDQNLEPSENTPGDPRIGLKARLLTVGGFAAAAQVVLHAPFGDEDVFAGSAGFTVEPKLIVERRLGTRGALALNVGARLRDGIVAETREVSMDGFVRNDANGQAVYRPLLYVGSELLVSLGARVGLSRRLAVGAEVYALLPIAKASDAACPAGCRNGDLTADALGGVFLAVTGDTTVVLAGGAGLVSDAARRDAFRVVAAVSWSPSAEGAAGLAADRDGDGIGDQEDLCPDEAEDRDGFQDDDGCPDPDNDLDGIADKDDKCPREPEDKDGFQDDDGCPDIDDDGDGILDKDDKCPNEPETVNGVDDMDGCPDQSVQGGPRMGPDRIDLQGERVEFVGRSARPTAATLRTLDAVAAVMKQFVTVRIRIEVGVERSGDSRRSRLADQKLSADRARAVQAYLGSKGIRPAQVDTAPLGSDRPIDAKNPKDPRLNRRVELIRVTQ